MRTFFKPKANTLFNEGNAEQQISQDRLCEIDVIIAALPLGITFVVAAGISRPPN